MPTERKYTSNAQKQSAYRQRRAAQIQAQLESKGIPPLPAIPRMPGHRRWKVMVEQARYLIDSALHEMETFSEQRSEAWQDSEKAAEFTQTLESIQDAASALVEVPY